MSGGRPPLLEVRAQGLYCPAGEFYIDPRRPVPRAVVTHAHADHARPGSGAYLAQRDSAALLRQRLGASINLETLAYGETRTVNGVAVSLHPAGHIRGSAQIRLDRQGEVWVVTGDFKTEADPTCAPFEPQTCRTLVMEATFGLPVFRWPRPEAVLEQIHAWWRDNREAGRASLLQVYALGKAQRVLQGLDPRQGPIVAHEAVEAINRHYREGGVALPATLPEAALQDRGVRARCLVLTPPAAAGRSGRPVLSGASRALASGWMRLRRRRRELDGGFVLSDHADWEGLQAAVAASGAETVWLHHGYAAPLARYLAEGGWQTLALGNGTGAAGNDPGPAPEGEA